jgi:DNA-directed RNA polymerase subunit RPC12/RpoP
MTIIKIKEKYENNLKRLNDDISEYENSSNNELRIAARTLKVEAEKLKIIVDALQKQIPIKVCVEYDNEFTCPTCEETTEDYDVTTYKVCPECGQKICFGD